MQPVQAFPPALRKMFRGAVHRGPLRALRKPQDPGKETRHPRLPPLFQTERGRRETGAGRSKPVRIDLGTVSFFGKKVTVPTPKKKACPGPCKVLLSPAPWNTVITGKHHFRALRPAFVLLSEQMRTPWGRLGVICTAASRLRSFSTAPRLPREGAPKGFEFVPKALPGTAGGGQESCRLFHIVPRRREQN